MAKKSNMFINTLVLVLVSVIAVASLAVVNQLTADKIAEADKGAEALQYVDAYPDMGSTAEVDAQLIADSETVLADAGFTSCKIVKAFTVDEDGYLIISSSSSGYGGDVQVAIGIKDGKLTGFAPISHKETPGFGAEVDNDDAFKGQFAGKEAAILTFTKTGAKEDTEIDALSGATVTTNAVTEAVNAAIVFYQANFGGGVQEIEGPDYTEFYQQAYPGATSFEDVDGADKMIEDSTKLLEQCGLTDSTILEIKSVNGGEGYVVASTGIGFVKTSPIQITIGIKDNKITGYAVISHMETDIYGAALDKEPFASQFAGKDADIMTEIDKIDLVNSATRTTNGVKSAINAAIVFYQTNLGDGTIQIDTDALANSSVDAEAGATA